MEVRLPDGVVVLAQGRLDLVPAERPGVPDYALYLDARWDGDPAVTWPNLMADWPDFSLPADEVGLFEAVVELHQRAAAGQLVEVACFGGIGRTGTVLACLAQLGGPAAGEAVAWVRTVYHPAAVETPAQEALVERFGAWWADHSS
ncbi:MAG TPA: protein-tyrosine phosphatase family protein [Acidimicrobiales bacterium]